MRTSRNSNDRAQLQVSPEVGTWLARRSSRADDWTADQLVEAKRGTTVSVVIPARNEEATVGAIVTAIREELCEHHRLVDEILVVDSHSTDATAEVAAAALRAGRRAGRRVPGPRRAAGQG